ncbi:hypothetical protein [Bacillus sinesaloumensis]|uniref:hypothetical protein n=1 Tax=Litchfieldia sinesaloumensis TaxID=1926280 RepID=UPI0009886A71|nr:hypothetical protein [Bacillus sinesaloumensis]
MLRITIDTSSNIQGYSQFYDFEEFRLNIEVWFIDHQKEFTQGELYGLNQLIQLSSDIPGICHVAIKSVVCCQDEGLSEHIISRSTFKRMIWKCIEIGMLRVYETVNKQGAQCGNLYVFNRYPDF